MVPVVPRYAAGPRMTLTHPGLQPESHDGHGQEVRVTNVDAATLSIQSDGETAKAILLHVSKAVHYLHANRSIHGHVLLENVSVSHSPSVKAVWKVQHGQRLEPEAHDVRFAPEVRASGLWSSCADVYGLGIILCQIITGGRLPVETQRGLDLTSVVDPHVFDDDPGLLELLSAMLAPDASQRPTIMQVLNHAWLAKGPHRTLPPLDYDDIDLKEGQEVQVLRVSRGHGAPPLDVRVVARDVTELEEPHAVLVLPACASTWETEARDNGTVLGAVMRRLGLADLFQEAAKTTPATSTSESRAEAAPKAASIAFCPQQAAQPYHTVQQQQPTEHQPHYRRLVHLLMPSRNVACPYIRTLFLSLLTDEERTDQGMWQLHRTILSSTTHPSIAGASALVLPTSLYIPRSRGSVPPHRLASEICSLATNLAAQPPTTSTFHKILLVASDVDGLREVLRAFESLDGRVMSDVCQDLPRLAREVQRDFEASGLSSNWELKACFESLAVLEPSLLSHGSSRQVCLLCGKLGRLMTSIALEGPYDVPDVLVDKNGRHCIALLNDEQVDKDIETLDLGLEKASGRWVELLSPYDALQSLQAVRRLLCAMSSAPRWSPLDAHLMQHQRLALDGDVLSMDTTVAEWSSSAVDPYEAMSVGGSRRRMVRAASWGGYRTDDEFLGPPEPQVEDDQDDESGDDESVGNGGLRRGGAEGEDERGDWERDDETIVGSVATTVTCMYSLGCSPGQPLVPVAYHGVEPISL